CLPIVWQISIDSSQKLMVILAVKLLIAMTGGQPAVLLMLPLFDVIPGGINMIRNFKGRVGPVQFFPDPGNPFRPQRCTMGSFTAGYGRSITYDCLANDQGWPAVL